MQAAVSSIAASRTNRLLFLALLVLVGYTALNGLSTGMYDCAGCSGNTTVQHADK